ncbi:hypothetical protein QBZ16_002313 [Prototheca wickerhamii]|uniref:SAC3/GANP/THP3 conserved domain-containing protein n=1 Tax=Prototheca wickerhamii TaxID=3111 RepID=A0AAD9ILQ7_PROWI|nr:hypothetical protein QBZ16_002313 [Prototheca wickerhamii]
MPTSIRPSFLPVPAAARPAGGAAPPAGGAPPAPSAWPSSLKAYVERAFVATPTRLRPALQQPAPWRPTFQPTRAQKQQQRQDQGGQEAAGAAGGVVGRGGGAGRGGQRAAARASRFGGGGSEADAALPASFAESRARRRRVLQLMEDSGGALPEDEADWDALAIKGTSTSLEKSYYRLTSAPHPSTVRPEPVLREALVRLTTRVARGEVGYFYALDQFKGLRQDCTVQHLRGELTLRVYRAHARAALEYGDLQEYNQCQGRLFALEHGALSAEKGSGAQVGSAGPGDRASDADTRAEFLAYRILYQAAHARQGEGGPALLRTLRALRADPAAAAHPAVRHALAAQRALAARDCARFARLRACAPRLSAALMDLALPALRFEALGAAVKAFRPGIAVRYEGEGAPAGDEASGTRACLLWLEECQALVTRAPGEPPTLNCKDSLGRLVPPAPKEVVAHGDANLDIGDFLKSVAAW